MMASTAVKTNPIKDSSNKLTSSTSEKKKAKAGVKGATPRKYGSKNPTSSSGRGNSSKSSRSGKNKKPSSKGRSKDSGSSRSNRDKYKSGSKRKSGSRSNSAARKSKSQSGSKKVSKRGADTIKLSCGSDVYYVSSRHFAACSNLIKKELAVNAHTRSVDLKQFDKTTVRVLAEYIESKKIKTDISFYSLAELLKFSKVFEMDNLRMQLEKFVAVIASNDLATLHQVLLIIGITTVSRPTEREIMERAARSFMDLAAQSTFQRIPFNIIITLFARCDLNVNNEVQVVDAMLLWLAGQANPLSVAPSLFYLVRHDFIHSIQKAFIVERARALRLPEDVLRTIERCFECRNGARLCVLKEHYEAKYARCGIADASRNDAKNPYMPLSLPREAIFYKPTPAETEAAKSDNPGVKSSQARPYYHAPPACSGKGQKNPYKEKSKSQKGESAYRKRGSSTRNSSSRSSKSSGKSSGSHKSSRSKKETKPNAPSKGKKTSSSSKKGKKPSTTR